MEINEENLFSHGISKNIDIEKNEAIDLLTERIDLNSLELCDNLNLYYNNQPFLVKIANRFFSVQSNWSLSKKGKKIVVESDAVKRLLSEIFYRIEAAFEKKITSLYFVLQV